MRKVKKTTSCLAVFLMLIMTHTKVVTQSVAFIHNDFEKAITLAQLEDKLIFVDVYTTWCGPCKQMDKTTFQDSTVSSFMNDAYTNLKLNAESEIGIPLSDKWKVRSYPTFLVLDSEGEEISRHSGYMDAEKFLTFATTVQEGTADIDVMNMEIFSSLNADDQAFFLKKLEFFPIHKQSDYFIHYFDKRMSQDSLGKDALSLMFKNLTLLDTTRLKTFITTYIPDKVSPYDMEWARNRGSLQFFFMTAYASAVDSLDETTLNALHNIHLLSNDRFPDTKTLNKAAVKLYEKNLLNLYNNSPTGKEKFHQLCLDMMEKYILSIPHARIRNMDKMFSDFLEEKKFSGIDSLEIHHKNSYEITRRITDLSKKHLLKFDDAKHLDPVSKWLAYGIELLPYSELFLLSAQVQEVLGNEDKSNSLKLLARQSTGYDQGLKEMKKLQNQINNGEK